MDYYSTLGLKRGASDDDIKKAYRSLAMKHHPDRGGDERKFKEVEEAYRTLSDPQKKHIVDLGGDPNNQHQHQGFGGQPFEFHFGAGDINDIFGSFGFGARPQRKNASLSVNVEITLEDVLSGKDLNAEVGLPGTKKKIVNISIPAGIEHGQQIRYQGMGDDTLRDLRPGDLLVNVIIRPHARFRREGPNIIHDCTISVWDAILGTSIEIITLDNKKLNVSIPPGCQHDTVLSCKGEGLPNMRTHIKGNLFVKIKIDIPKHLSSSQLEKIKSIKNNQ